MNKIAAILWCILSLAWTTASWAQNVAVSGKVTGANGEAIIGANVLVEGTTQGITTNVDGDYTLTNIPANATLVVSYLGYKTEKIPVGNKTRIDVTLREDTAEIEGVMVVAYGTAKKESFTGSAAVVKGGELQKRVVGNVTKSFEGTVAGVQVASGGGQPGEAASVIIRGIGSVNASATPLYVVDGIPFDGSLSAINPADIETMTVLKDASAGALYGARGANGVIVINTKRGNEGKPTVNFSASFSLNKIANKADLMDSYEFVRLQSELISEETMNKSYFSEGLTLDDYRHIPGIDWQDQLYRTAFQQNYNVSLSGGNKEGLRYNVGFSALDQDGIIIRSNFQRYQGKANFTLPISKKLTLNANANYSRTATNGVTPTTAQTTSSSSGWLMYSVWGYRPVTPPGQDILDSMLDEAVDGSNDYRFNPVKTAKNEYRKTLVDYLNANLALTWKITPDLTFKTTGGYVLNKRRREEFNGSETYTGYARSRGRRTPTTALRRRRSPPRSWASRASTQATTRRSRATTTTGG